MFVVPSSAGGGAMVTGVPTENRIWLAKGPIFGDIFLAWPTFSRRLASATTSKLFMAMSRHMTGIDLRDASIFTRT